MRKGSRVERVIHLTLTTCYRNVRKTTEEQDYLNTRSSTLSSRKRGARSSRNHGTEKLEWVFIVVGWQFLFVIGGLIEVYMFIAAALVMLSEQLYRLSSSSYIFHSAHRNLIVETQNNVLAKILPPGSTQFLRAWGQEVIGG